MLRLALYDPPAEELGRLRSEDVPRWVLRLYWSYGYDAERAPLSAAVEALAEGVGRRLEELALALRKIEGRGWHVEVDGAEVVVASDLPRGATIEALDADGVWTVVRAHAVKDAAGEVAWR